MPRSIAAPFAASADLGRLVSKTLTITQMEVRKIRHDPSEMLMRTAQPMLWLLIFGQAFSRMQGGPGGPASYIEFLAPGILAQSVLFSAIFYGIAAIWERDLGIVSKLLVSPTPRLALVVGKALGAGMRSLFQGAVVYVLAALLGVHVAVTAAAIAGIVVFVFLGAALFSMFSLIIACIIRTRERFMGIAQLLTMPFFFASSAIYPIDVMPGWLRAVAHVNPLTYEVDGLRALMLAGGVSHFGLALDGAVLFAVAAILAGVAAALYPRLGR